MLTKKIQTNDTEELKVKRAMVKKKKIPEVINELGPNLLKYDEANKAVRQDHCPVFCKKDATGVERLLCPYNTFHIKRSTYTRKKRMSSNSYDYAYCQGISPKERNYLVCSCQRKKLRYCILKSYAAKAIDEKKIFTISGQCSFIRTALANRGWVEKIPAARMDVSTVRSKQYSDEEIDVRLERLLLSTLVEKASPTFIWHANSDFDRNKDTTQHSNALINRLRHEAIWATKQGLCSVLQNYRWCHIDDKAEVTCPRTYASFNEEDRADFLDDYKLTACTSLLKWVLSMVANKRQVCHFSGTINFDVIVFALNRCKEYLTVKHNEDIDSFTASKITEGQWDTFLKKYYSLMARQDLFVMDTENMLPVYVEYGKFLLKNIYAFRPQLSCEGCHNIWIIKPAHWSRGRGIRMASKLGVLCDLHNQGKYVFQKYIEEPLLIHETKFDIRQYYLVSNTKPLEIWLYKDCYLKFSSQKYSLKNFHESIHLTNHAVQKKYTNCDDRHPELPDTNMWSLNTYKEYLRDKKKEHVWDKVIYPGMRKAILGTMLCCQESMAYNKNRFELYGCDFILDKDYKPWLIEINACPDLNATTDVTANICSAVLEDLVKVMVDRAENSSAPTGNFECIYRENSGLPYRAAGGHNFLVQGHALKLSYFKGNLEHDTKFNDVVYVPHDFNSLLEQIKNTSGSDIMLNPGSCDLASDSASSKNLCKTPPPTIHQNSNEIIKSAITDSAYLVSDFLDRITSEFSESAGFNNKSRLSFSSSIDYSPMNSNQENCDDGFMFPKKSEGIINMAENPVQIIPASCSKAALAPIFGDVKWKENKMTNSSGSESPKRENILNETRNFGDHNPKLKKCYRKVKKITAKQEEVKSDTQKGKSNLSDVLAATTNLFLFFKQKEQEYKT